MKYFKLPFESSLVYIRDANHKTVFNWLVEDEELRKKIIDAINTESTLGLGNVVVDDPRIMLDGKPILIVRGWGYLTGTGGGLGLDREEAIKEQMEVLNYVAKCIG